jgi:hypothetical protein
MHQRLELLEKQYFPARRQVCYRNKVKVTLITKTELEFLCAVTKKCEELDLTDAEVLRHAYDLLTEPPSWCKEEVVSFPERPLTDCTVQDACR